MKQLVLFGFLLLGLSGQAQQFLTGRVIDRQSNEPLAFANLVFDDNKQTAVTSDIDGRFSFPSTDLRQVECSYLGYRTVKVAITSTDLTIRMEPQPDLLREVDVHRGESRATQIMRRVIANKPQNDPEQLRAFRYRCYNKVSFDFLYNKDKRDSIKIYEKIGNSRLLLMESATERKYKKPGLSEETIIATRVSGFERPGFAALATDLQPMSFYRDNIPLFNVQYLNPIADGSLSKYHFALEEERIREHDTIFVISFQPRPQKNFDGLKGVLYINSNRYAVQQVDAEPFQKGKINIKIQQQYQWVAGHWFPEQLNYVVTIDGYPNANIGLYSEGKSYLRDVSINPPIAKKDFSDLAVGFDRNAMTKDTAVWNRERAVPLSAIEQQTYRTIDSIGKVEHFDRYLTLTEKLIQGRLPLGSIDLDLAKTLVYNKYEGFRLGTGLLTNDRLSRYFTLGAFLGFGLKDHDWKYGGRADFALSDRTQIGLDYQDNLIEIGCYGLRSFDNGLYSLRNFIGSRYDRIREQSVHLKTSRKFLTAELVATYADIEPKYGQPIAMSDPSAAYQTASVALHLRYAFGEKKVSSFGSTFQMASGYPVVQLLYVKGFSGIGSDWSYNRLECAVEQSVYTKNLGTTKYRIQAGYIDTDLPTGQLFTGEGADDPDMLIVVKNTFQTMQPYEFLSDRFARAFFTHNFGPLLFRSRHFAPDISVLHNMGVGQLSHPERHREFAFRTQEHVFLESGLRLENIVKFNYRNIGYLGLGAAAFYRYGAYAFAEAKDNLAVKIALSFSIR